MPQAWTPACAGVTLRRLLGHAGPRFRQAVDRRRGWWAVTGPESTRGGECPARNVPLNAISMSPTRRELRPVRHSGPTFVIPAQAGIQRGGRGWSNVARGLVPRSGRGRRPAPLSSFPRRRESRGAGQGHGVVPGSHLGDLLVQCHYSPGTVPLFMPHMWRTQGHMRFRALGALEDENLEDQPVHQRHQGNHD